MSKNEISILKFHAGANVIVQNAPNEGYFYVVKSGTLKADSARSLADKDISIFKEGDSFGLVSAFTGHHFLVSITATTEAVVARIPVSMIGSYLHDRREIAIRILTVYSHELQAIQQKMNRVNIPAERDIHPAKLLAHAGIYQANGEARYAIYALHKFIDWAGSKGDQQAALERARKQLADLVEEHGDYRGAVFTDDRAVLEDGEVLFLENEVSDELYLIKSGSVKLFKLVKGHEMIIDVLGPGELFGELAIIDHRDRMASAVTDSHTELVQISKQALFETLGEAVLQKIFEGLARRIWFSYQRFEILRIPDPMVRLYSFVYVLILEDDFKKRSASGNDSHTFYMTQTELKKMCGLLSIDDERIGPFLKDSNFVFEENQFTVKNRKMVESKVAFYKSKVSNLDTQVF